MSGVIKAFNPGRNCDGTAVTGTNSTSGKRGLDVFIVNPDDVSSSSSCITSFVYHNLTVTTTEQSISLTQQERTFITITNTSEFHNVFVANNPQFPLGAGADVILPCGAKDICVNSMNINTLYFFTEEGTARVIVAQGLT